MISPKTNAYQNINNHGQSSIELRLDAMFQYMTLMSATWMSNFSSTPLRLLQLRHRNTYLYKTTLNERPKKSYAAVYSAKHIQLK